MSELSNLLRQRLGAPNSAEANGAGVHPDADTLTAYTEQLLSAAERQQVLKHLSACGECREVLALSQAEVPEVATQPILKPAPVSLWRKLFSPAFGLAGAVAAMALIAVLVLEIPQKSGQQQANKEARVAPSSEQKTASEPKPAPVQPDTATAFSGQEVDAATRGKDRDKRSGSATVAGLAAMAKTAPLPNKIASVRQSAPAQTQPILAAELKKQDFINSAFFETSNADVVMVDQNGNAYPSAPQPHASATEATLKATAPGQITNFYDIPASAGSNKSNVRILASAPPPPDHFGFPLGKLMIKGARSVFRPPSTVPAIRSNSLTSNAMSINPKFADTQKAEQGTVAAVPAKSENAELAVSNAFSPRSRSALSSAETAAATWKVADGKLFKAFGQSPWEEARTPAAFQFTVVNAHGGEVWAGGANAGLIHSYDGGNTWETHKLGEAASGAIVSIAFSGNNVQVKTSDSQSWSSSDGGKSWAQN